MTFIKKTALSLIFYSLFLPAALFSQTSPGNNRSLTDTITHQLALAQQLQEVPDDIKSQFQQNPLQLSDEKNKQMLHLFDEAYSSELLIRDFKSALQQKIAGQHDRAISEWLQQSSTQAITAANQEYYTLQGKRKRVLTMYEMDQKQPSARRVNIIASLADTTSAAKNTVESSVVILRSVIEALNRLSEQRNFSDSQIDTIVNNFKSQLQGPAAAEAKSKLMVTYYNVKLSDLETYVTFMQTDTGQWLQHVIQQSMQSAYQAAADRFLQSVNSNM